MLGAELVGPARRMERIADEHEARRREPGGYRHRADATTHRSAAEEKGARVVVVARSRRVARAASEWADVLTVSMRTLGGSGLLRPAVRYGKSMRSTRSPSCDTASSMATRAA